MREIRFMHMADLHLDSPFIGLKNLPVHLYNNIKEATFLSFKRSISIAIEQAVEFVLIAGDIYDNEDQSVHAQVQFHQEMVRLNQAGIPVYLIHGNHDFRQSTHDYLSLPENVHTFGKEVEHVTFISHSGVKVNIYGFSYHKRHVLEDMSSYYQMKERADFNIAMLHGSEVSHKENHDVYAPFTIKNLAKKGFDYWALGHIHAREQLSMDPLIYYPGNIQGRHRKESGEKGCTLVTLSEGVPVIEFCPTAPVIWQTKSIVFTEPVSKTQLFREIEFLLNSYEDNKTSYFLHLVIEAPNKSALIKEDWLSAMNELAPLNGNQFVWITHLTFKTSQIAAKQDWWKQTFMADEWQKAQAYFSLEDSFFKQIESLYFHAGASRFLEDLKTSERGEIIQEAMRLLGEKVTKIEE